MALYRVVQFVLFILLISASSAFSSSIQLNEMIESHAALGHSRFKPPKRCPVDFEHKNYTNFVRMCRRPYKAEPCCNALRSIACPHWREVNDMSTDCAVAMFASINYHGKYPTGLFFRLCAEKNGMECPD